jgi:DTW domain-containing protein YfiP
MARGPVDLSLRCRRCLFLPEACLCGDVRPARTRTHLLAVRHASELLRPTNSVRWAALALPELTVVDYALPGGSPDVTPLVRPGAAVLFPSPHPAPLAAPPSQLVVVDGTWAQARRMVQRLPALRTLPRLSLPPAAAAVPSRFGPMRRTRVAGHRSTLEALAAALHLLGEEDAARALEALYAVALERAWRLRRGGAPWSCE